MQTNSIGIIGFGAFGQFMLGHLYQHFDQVSIYDLKVYPDILLPENTKFSDIEKTLSCDIIILAIPVQYLEKFLLDNAEKFNKNSLVIDICSVKTIPSELMNKYLSTSIQILASHPLFGKYSGKNGIKGLKIMLHPVRLNNSDYSAIKDFLQDKLELEIIETTPELHDQEMAYVQALTFFIGKGINGLQIPDGKLKTPTYQYLLNIKEVVGSDTDDLFFTIQKYNPFAEKVRLEFMQKLGKIEQLVSGVQS
jgi:prephenate dehydrogenase